MRGVLVLACIGLVCMFFQDRRRNKTLDEIRVKYNLPALGVSIFSFFDSDTYVVGKRNDNSKEKVQEGDKFHLGSCTKIFTATLFAMFVENGKISFQTRIKDVFPELAIHKDLQNVTMDMLLRHQSGIVSDLDMGLKMQIAQATDDVMRQRRFAVQEMLKLAPEKVDEFGYCYSNNGYILLGAVMEKLSGLSWEELIRRKIFEPLHMRESGFGNPCKDSSKIDHPWPHSGDKYPIPVNPSNTFENYQGGVVSDNPAFYGPAATIHCSIGDLRGFLKDQCSGYQRGIGKLFSRDMYYKMYDGIEITRNSCVVVDEGSFGCAGSNTLNYALFAITPENDSGYIAVTNFAGKDMEPARKALYEVIGFIIEEKTRD